MGAVQAVSVERVRGPKLAVLVRRAEGVPVEEGLRRANDAGRVIASNARLDGALVGSEEWRTIRDVFACWTGTAYGYVEPDRVLREATERSDVLRSHVIVYTDTDTGKRWLFPVPEEHLDRRNVLLAMDHPDFTLETDGNDRIFHPVQGATIGMVEGLPARDGWYGTDSRYGIPNGNPINALRREARYLLRTSRSVGLVRRGYDGFDGDDRQCVGLDDRPSQGFGVAVEAAEGGAPR